MPRLPGVPRSWALAALAGVLLGPHPGRAEERPLRQLIDAEVRAAWQRENVTPAGPADDATFLRRVSLDLAGAIPSYDEARTFLADADPHKREKLIDRLLADPRYAAH